MPSNRHGDDRSAAKDDFFHTLPGFELWHSVRIPNYLTTAMRPPVFAWYFSIIPKFFISYNIYFVFIEV